MQYKASKGFSSLSYLLSSLALLLQSANFIFSMNKYFTFALALFCLGQVQAQSGGGTTQIGISEVFFNTPVGGGTDSLEFVELRNNGTGLASLNGLRVYSGNNPICASLDGLPVLSAGEYRIIARDSAFLVDNLGVNPALVLPYALTSNINNTNATIRLSYSSDPADAIDSLSYETRYPWYSATGGANVGSSGTTGFGHSLERCDNFGPGFDPNTWNFSTTHSGYTRNLDGVFVTVYASPGTANTGCSANFNSRYPLYTIADATTASVRGVVDSFGRTMELRGVVHSENFRTSGFAFALIDAGHNGIQVFSASDVNGYTPTFGDSLQVYGTLSFANGTPQLIVDSLFVAATGQALLSPIVVQEPTEATEGQLIQINDVTINAATWSGMANGFTAQATNSAGDVFDLRIQPGSYYINQAAPTGTLSIIGISGQFQSNASPPVTYNSGYQIQPRIMGDIDVLAAATFPVYEISQINGLDADGVADSLGVACELRAVVHSENFRNTTGVAFSFIDYSNTGIWVFSNNDVTGFSSVNRGDSLHIQGTVTQFNGVLQFIPDTIIVAGQGDLVQPLVVTNLDESTENKLVKLENLVRIDTTINTGAGRNVRFLSTSGDTVTIRVVGTLPLINETYDDCDTLTVIGIGYQFDNSSPYTSGYQMYPRDVDDIEELCNVTAIEALPASSLRIFPNPAQYQVQIELEDATIEAVRVSNTLGQLVWNSEANTAQAQLSIDVQNWAAGMYILQVQTSKGTVTRQFIVQK